MRTGWALRTRHLIAAAMVAAGLTAAGALPAAAAGPGWSPAGVMAQSRSDLTATVLPDGSVLVAGGTSISAAAERWRSATRRWTPAGSMSVARSGATATLLAFGKVLVVGGCTGSHCSSVTTSAELYDPGTNSWTATGSTSTPHGYATATLLASGKVLLAGGCTGRLCGQLSASAELYDPQTGRWTPTAPMHAARRYAAAALLPSGQVLVAGGKLEASAELYTPGTGRWTPTGTMRTARGQFTLTPLPDGQVLAAGGCTGSYCTDSVASAEVYSPTTGRWTGTGPLRQARQRHTATPLPDGTVLLAGGQPTGRADLRSAELYDPTTHTFTTTASMRTTHAAHAAVALTNGEVLVVGGYTDDTELYQP